MCLFFVFLLPDQAPSLTLLTFTAVSESGVSVEQALMLDLQLPVPAVISGFLTMYPVHSLYIFA